MLCQEGYLQSGYENTCIVCKWVTKQFSSADQYWSNQATTTLTVQVIVNAHGQIQNLDIQRIFSDDNQEKKKSYDNADTSIQYFKGVVRIE